MNGNVLGKRLRKLREKRGLSQKEAAKVFGISNFALSRYENGTANPDPELIAMFAEYYEVSSDYLLGITDKTNPIPTIAFHRFDDPMADLPEEARKSVEEFIDYIKKKYNIKDD